MNKSTNKILIISLLAVLFAQLSTTLAAGSTLDKTIRVRLSVRNEQGHPVSRAVIIRDEHFEVGRTNEDGKIFVNVTTNAVLKVYAPEYADLKFNVEGRQDIELTLLQKMIQVDEVVVTAKARPSKKLFFEPTDIEVKGNYLHLKTRFRVPLLHYNTDTRLVVQPIMVDVAANKESLLHPYVAQGKRHTIVRERAFGFDIKQDPLNIYRVEEDITEGQNVVSYHDSLYVRYGNDDYLARVLVGIENYHKVVYLDTLVIARGTSNPLRFLDYQFAATPLDERALLPEPEMALFQDKGVTRILFDASSAKIDTKKEVNRKELAKIEQVLSRLRSDSMLTIRSISLEGFASPEGNQEQNERLARRRTLALQESVRDMLGVTANQLELTSTSNVASWVEVADLLDRMGKKSQVEQMRKVLHLYRRDPVSQAIAVRRLPFYKTDVIGALAELRRVEYTIDYSEFRTMSDEEIWEVYRRDKRRLTRYDYYRLIETVSEDKKEKLLRESLAVYPGFLLAANRLVLMLIGRDSVDLTILAPFVKPGAPGPVIANQLKMHLMLKNIEQAAELAGMLPDTEDYTYNKAVVQAMNGDFAGAFAVMSPYGGLNEVLLLLTLRRNEEAYQKVKLLNQSIPKVLYVRAVCADRMEDITDAMQSMRTALKLDPSLADIARVDSDATDIFNLVNDVKE